jgi:hypothetical protein
VGPFLHFEPYVRSRKKVTDGEQIKTQTVLHREGAFQIISAGRDRWYGQGGIWPLKSPVQKYDRDNLTNFAERRLEVGG